MPRGCRVTTPDAQPHAPDLRHVADPTQAEHKNNRQSATNVTAVPQQLSQQHPNTLTLGSGSGGDWTSRTALYWGRAIRDLGTPVATYPRGLTSNRHAGRPDRWPIRAFALGRLLRTTAG